MKYLVRVAAWRPVPGTEEIEHYWTIDRVVEATDPETAEYALELQYPASEWDVWVVGVLA